MVETALQLVNEHGLEQLTTSRLARALGVAVVTLYNYVADREDLLDAIVERAVSDIPLPQPVPGNPTAAIRQQWMAYREFLLSHPGAYELIVRSVRSGERLFSHIEASLVLLVEAGADPEPAVRAHTALLTYTTGFVQWELPRSHGQPTGTYAASVHQAVDGLDRDRYQMMVGSVDALASAPTEGGFLAGLDALLVGFGLSR